MSPLEFLTIESIYASILASTAILAVTLLIVGKIQDWLYQDPVPTATTTEPTHAQTDQD